MDQSLPVNHEYYYPDLLAVREYIENLVAYCDKAYNSLKQKVDEEEERNEPLKYDYREYNYKKSFGMSLRISLFTNNSNSLNYDNGSAFQAAAGSGKLNNVSNLTIDLNLSFGRGKEGAIEEHKNEFKITFKPYNIVFIRNSSFDDPEMDQIEEQIKKILEDFPVTKTIFSPEQKIDV